MDVTSSLIVNPGFLGSKIKTADQFTNNHEVNAAADDLRTQRRKVCQFRRQGDGAEVRVRLVAPAHGQKASTLGLLIYGNLLRLLMAEPNGAFEDGIGVVADRNGFIGKRLSGLIPGAGAKQGGLQIKCNAVSFFYKVKNFFCLGHDFRADAVAGEQGNLVCCHIVKESVLVG